MEITLQERNYEIETLNSNVAMLESTIVVEEMYRDSLLALLEESNSSNEILMSIIEDSNNSILALLNNLEMEQNLVEEWVERAFSNDFSHMDLTGYDLSSVDFSGADLRYADLSGVYMEGALSLIHI